MAAGLPNIKGTIGYTSQTELHVTGCFYAGSTGYKVGTPNAGTKSHKGVEMDASRSSNVYGASTTVQPPAIILIPQIRY